MWGSEISFNMQDVPSVRLPTQGMKNPQRCFGETIPKGKLSTTFTIQRLACTRNTRFLGRIVNVLTKPCRSASSFLPFLLYLLLTFHLSHYITYPLFLSLILSSFLTLLPLVFLLWWNVYFPSSFPSFSIFLYFLFFRISFLTTLFITFHLFACVSRRFVVCFYTCLKITSRIERRNYSAFPLHHREVYCFRDITNKSAVLWGRLSL
jgi:hypothetical protein